MQRASVVVALFASTLLMVTRGAAQEPAPQQQASTAQLAPEAEPAGPASGKSRYEELLETAQTAFAGRYLQSAVDAALEAHRINPGFRTLKIIARLYQAQNHHALAMLYASRAEAESGVTPEMISVVKEIKSRSQAHVSRYGVVVAPMDAEVTLDGHPIQLDPEGYVWVKAGDHVAVARATGYVEQARNFTAVAGVLDGQVLRFELRPEGEEEEDQAGGSSVLPWALIGTGGAFVVGATITGLIALGEAGTLDDECNGNDCDPSLEGTRDNAETLAVVTDILWISGAIVAGIGVTLLVMDDAGEQQTAGSLQLTPAVGPDGGGVIATGRF